MKTITKLSEEQIQQLEIVREKWINKMFTYENFKNFSIKRNIELGVKLYEFCGLEKKPIVITLDSPMACQIAANIINKKMEGDDKFNFFNFSNYVNYSDFGWLSFYDYFLGNTNIIDEFKESIKFISECVDNMFMSIQFDNYLIISRYPNKIIRNANNNLHSINEYAIEFVDGYGQYYVNGKFLSDEIFIKLKNNEYSFSDFVNETNEETKSAVLDFIKETKGESGIVNFLSEYIKEVDTYVHKTDEKYLVGTTKSTTIGVYTLFKGKINNIDLSYVRCYCPSTDRIFFLGVTSNFNNAKDAIASLYRIPKKLRGYIDYIQRQGERYSTILTDEGDKLVLTLTKEELADLVSISGSEYFSKIRYEY